MNNGFTLIELLGVLVILSIILAIVTLSVSSVISDSEKSISDIQKIQIEDAAKIYYLKEGNLEEDTCVSINELLTKGYLEDEEVIDPKTREAITGSVNITYASNQYSYNYQVNSCE